MILQTHITLVAGETSGDHLAAAMLQGLHVHTPELNVYATGLGGPAMQAQGMLLTNHIDELAVRGYVEVLRHLPRLLRLRAEIARTTFHAKPDLFLGVDAPDFNLKLEQQLKSGGVKTAHFISPSI